MDFPIQKGMRELRNRDFLQDHHESIGAYVYYYYTYSSSFASCKKRRCAATVAEVSVSLLLISVVLGLAALAQTRGRRSGRSSIRSFISST